MHPDILHVPGGFAGAPYWMAFTPYPYGHDRHENPCVRVSDDGLRWRPVAGAPDPIVDAPSEAWCHHADTDLVHFDGRLHLFFIRRDKREEATRVVCVRSRDGVRWSAPETVYDSGWAVSPSVVADAAGWTMWFVRTDPRVRGAASVVLRATSADGRAFTGEAACQLEVPGHVPWHLDVIRRANGFEAFVTAYPRGRDASRSRLFHAVSADGVVFRVAPAPLLSPTWRGWDNRMIYRTSALAEANGHYRVWYSGGCWGGRFGIGYVEGSLASLHPAVGAGAPRARGSVWNDLLGWLKYLILWNVPAGVLQRIRGVLGRAAP